jgi:hypothetical protein
VFEEGGVTFCYVQHNNLYLLAVTRLNTNAMAVITFIHHLIAVFAHYFGELEEESLRDNFVICYELLDEVRVLPAHRCARLGFVGCGSTRVCCRVKLTAATRVSSHPSQKLLPSQLTAATRVSSHPSQQLLPSQLS